MMSVSGGWFFVVASEAITVAGQTILLPGIGSYIATAIEQRDLGAIGYAVLVMLVVILLYDQLLFRPLLAWSRKFVGDPRADEDYVRPWFLIVLQRARLFDLVQTRRPWRSTAPSIRRSARGCCARCRPTGARPRRRSPLFERLFDAALLALAGAGGRLDHAVRRRERRTGRDRLGFRARR